MYKEQSEDVKEDPSKDVKEDPSEDFDKDFTDACSALTEKIIGRAQEGKGTIESFFNKNKGKVVTFGDAAADAALSFFSPSAVDLKLQYLVQYYKILIRALEDILKVFKVKRKEVVIVYGDENIYKQAGNQPTAVVIKRADDGFLFVGFVLWTQGMWGPPVLAFVNKEQRKIDEGSASPFEIYRKFEEYISRLMAQLVECKMTMRRGGVQGEWKKGEWKIANTAMLTDVNGEPDLEDWEPCKSGPGLSADECGKSGGSGKRRKSRRRRRRRSRHRRRKTRGKRRRSVSRYKH